jgi:glutaminyl-peptide cyclotransferase
VRTMALLGMLLALGCGGAPADVAADPPKRDQFAQDRATPGGPNVKAIPFDGDRAIKYLKTLCDLGPRISASDGMKKQQEIIVKHCEGLGGKVIRQSWDAKQKSRKSTTPMVNLIVQFQPEKAKRIILCTHYDTRPSADEEEDRSQWAKPFMSANDGTSGVAFLMEMAHHLKDLPCAYGIDLIFFDGEEYIFDKGRVYGEGDDFFLGSEHFGKDYEKNRRKLPYSYEAGVLFDLFAHENARLAVEGYSYAMAPNLVNEIWKTAAEVKAKSFRFERGFRRNPDVLDDHIALNRAGIPAVDIIDFDYAHWHRLTDTADKCSAKTMSEVGLVITTWLQSKK